MTLDAALFTLQFVRRRNQPWIVDIYPTSTASSSSGAPPVPSKDSASTSKPTAFTGTIPDLAAQRALALESTNFSDQTPSYTRVRAMNHTQYSTILLDGLVNDCLLASISQPYANNAKKKHILLYSPDAEVELEKRSMTFQQSWRFHFGDAASSTAEEFSWKREGGPSRGSSTQSAYVCEVIRRPDPSVLAAQYRPPAVKGKPGTLQLMDYNINRLDVQDKKGLEVVLVMSLSALLDQEYDEKMASRGERNMYICSSGIPTDLSTQGFAGAWQEAEARHRSESAVTTGSLQDGDTTHGLPRVASESSDIDAATADRIANLEPNELLITRWGSVDEYVQHALQLLRSDGQGQSMYLIYLLSHSPETTPKVVQVAAAIKAAYYRLPDDAKGTVYGRPSTATAVEDELYQYVQTLDDEEAPASAPAETTPKRRIIKLDPPSQTSMSSTSPAGSPGPRSSSMGYKPPSKLKVILSKERIAELEPKKHENQTVTASGAAQNTLNVPMKPSLPGRPVSPPSQQQPHPSSSTSAQHDKLGKGKALLSKLGLHS
ncbi:hypothetical protein PHSY_000220 [Pseudozyma hubeiensis SY62]|uniref:Uncharacterized protein n=1 Tax=Pseudozyma hubeiensis (strain SY62) TaxID=1305764 RepID=R9NW33_PSEHS|nr:hypothetical protein PHSY_000220 [Pseudozyma hubeiensis SY62]GAC92666.1 hypothetical protein PHSY_000220 [Pseudozyma hubeiensis SY62]